MQLSILPIGEVAQDVLEDLSQELRRGSGFEVALLPRQGVPSRAYDRRRKQYRAPAFLDIARQQEGDYVLAVTDLDLYAKPLNFVFGQAEIGGKVSVISLYRLRSTDRDRFLRRALKEALHELGHTKGLGHCLRESCVMHFSNTLADTDRKGPDYCPECESKLASGPLWRSA